MDVSTPPSLDLACLKWKPKSKNMSTCLEREVSIKTKYGHRSIKWIIITATNLNIKLYHRAFIIDFSWISNNSSQHRSIKHKLYWIPTNYVFSQLCNYNSSSFQEGSCIGAFLAGPHTHPSYSLLWLLILTAYTWAKRFKPDT